ncbi:hypothetical protein [Lacibacter sp. H407]|uniref:hypothetical protein n=1 Tax=Lacibacter sp. H407 TaxID=3133423 RepID=UPI0030C27196
MKFIFFLSILLISNCVFCQNLKHYKYWNGSFCSNHIYLNESTGIFYYQEGCEGTVSIAKGKFIRKKRNVIFNLDTGANVELNAIITSNKGGKSDSVYIQAIDFNEIPLRDFGIALLPFPTGTQFMTEMISTNDSGFVIVDRKKSSHFIYQNVIELNANTNREIPWIELDKENMYFTVMFNYPFYCLNYPHITISRNSTAILKIKKSKLIDKKRRVTYSLE